MYIDDKGKIILEKVKCWDCKGTKKVEKFISCPLNNKPVKGKGYPKGKCPHCGTKSKDRHGTIGTHIIKCSTCNGNGTIKENICSQSKKGDQIYRDLPFIVYGESTRKQTYNEYLLGFNCVYSTTDYGDHKSLTDKELIDKVKEHDWVQFIKISKERVKGDKEYYICDHIGIFTNQSGYSVRPVYKDNNETEIKLALESPKMEGFMKGIELSKENKNGTLEAIYQ